ncbi:hypothetical protein [Streptococcus sp. E17BB]|uniref:hypothetical protein n=2 Tax=unclassified Streptococcus TaxID=2608887 RepID=UPI00359D6536
MIETSKWNTFIKPLLILLGRVGLLQVFVWLLLGRLSRQFTVSITGTTFFRQGLWTFLGIDDFGNPYFDLIKLLLVFSILGIGFLSTIAFTSELSEQFYHVIKYHSANRFTYLSKRLRFQLKFFLADVMVWLLTSLVIYLYTKDLGIAVLLAQFLVVNFLGAWLISLLAPNTMYSLLGFVLLIFSQEFLFNNILLTLILFIVGIGGLFLLPFGSQLRGDES